MKKINIKLPDKIEPYKGVLYFMIILIVSHFFWKFNVLGDESDTIVTFWGLDISAPFNSMANHVALLVHKILNFIGYHQVMEPNNIMRYDNGNAARIVWACTGLKQAYIFTCIIGFYYGSLKNKLWYIPLGLIVVYLFNIFRIVVVVAVMYNHKRYFDFVHEELFKYLFYGVIFIMWVFWVEKIAIKK